MTTSRSCRGISFKSQALYFAVFVSRYLDLFWAFHSLYNTLMKLFFIGATGYTLYLMKYRYRATQDPALDTFKLVWILAPVTVLALIFNYEFSFAEIMWSFSIWLESAAILPQLFMLQRTGEAETITTHYLAALGLYRGLYIPNWIYRWVEGFWAIANPTATSPRASLTPSLSPLVSSRQQSTPTLVTL